jgi:hypothetical protein
MRCVIGIILFFVLYHGSCKVLGEYVARTTGGSDRMCSSYRAQRVAAEAVHKWHPHLMVGAGLTAILLCSLPSMLGSVERKSHPWQ